MDGRATPPRWTAAVPVLVAAALFGTTGTALARAPLGTSALGAGSLRLTIGSLGLAIVARRGLSTLRGAESPLVVGGLGVAVYQLAFFWSTRSTGVAMATVTTIAVSPVASRIIGRARGRAAPPSGWYVATAVLIVGLVLLVSGGSDSATFSTAGIVAAVIAGTAFAAYTEAGSEALARGADSTATMAGLFGVGAVASWLVLPFQPLRWAVSARGVLVLAYLGVVTLTVAYVAFGRGLRRLAPSSVVVLTIVEPLVASILAVTVLDERLSPIGWLGAVVVLAGVVIASVAGGDQSA